MVTPSTGSVSNALTPNRSTTGATWPPGSGSPNLAITAAAAMARQQSTTTSQVIARRGPPGACQLRTTRMTIQVTARRPAPPRNVGALRRQTVRGAVAVTAAAASSIRYAAPQASRSSDIRTTNDETPWAG